MPNLGGFKADPNFQIFTILATSCKFCSISAILGPIWMIFSLFDILMNIIDNLQHFLSTYTHFGVPIMENPQNRYFYPKK